MFDSWREKRSGDFGFTPFDERLRFLSFRFSVLYIPQSAAIFRVSVSIVEISDSWRSDSAYQTTHGAAQIVEQGGRRQKRASKLETTFGVEKERRQATQHDLVPASLSPPVPLRSPPPLPPPYHLTLIV